MTFWRRFIGKFRNFIRPARADREFDREVASHLVLLKDEFIRKGMNDEEAFWAAKRAYGGIEQVKELHREERSWFWLEQFCQDVRFSARALRKSRGFSFAVVLTLALGSGANTAVFSLIDALMLKVLPVSHPEQLVQVTTGNSPHVSNPVWEQLRDGQDIFSGLFAYGNTRFNLAAGGEARYVRASYASGQFFETLGLRALIGRTFTTADDRRGCPGTTVLSYDFWQKEYGGSAAVIGKTLSLDNHPFEILGVSKPGFTGVDVGSNRDLYVPVCTEKIIRGKTNILDSRFAVWLRIIGRLKPGTSATQVDARLKTLARRIFAGDAPFVSNQKRQERDQRLTLVAQSAATGLSFVRGQYRKSLMVLMAIVGVVLLIACANVANLLLARGAARQRELAIRLALGSGRGRLMRRLFTESLMLSLTGAVLGILFAQWGARLLVALLSSDVSNDHDVFLDLTIDFRMLAFTAGLAVLTTLLFGIVPAWRGTRVHPQAAMKANARGAMEGGKFGLGKALVAIQVALSLLLVASAGLMLSTFFRLELLDPGFERQHVLLAEVDLRNGHYSPAQSSAVFREILERLRALRGIGSVSSSYATPIDGSLSATNLQIESSTSKGNKASEIYLNQVSGHYFETMGTNLLAGRDFTANDTPGSPQVAIVNQSLARTFFAGANPIGRRYRTGEENKGALIEIVGVVKDAKYIDLREDSHPTAYAAISQDATPGESMTYEMRVTAGAPTTVISAVKAAIASVNPRVSLEFKTLEVQVQESLARERLLATLSGFFGALALVLATIGLYGMVSYNVTRRRNEIGIRMALGAQASWVLRMVLREVALLIGIGLAIGLGATPGASRLIAGFLYGTKPNDPWTISLAAFVLAAVAILAGFPPAYRASRLDPMKALREE